MPATKLKPCPFCGSSDIRILPQPDGVYTVDCIWCTAKVTVVTRYKRQAAAHWNQRRPPEPPPPFEKGTLVVHDKWGEGVFIEYADCDECRVLFHADDGCESVPLSAIRRFYAPR